MVYIKNPDTPKLLKFFSCIVLIYVLRPIDLILDFIPILGYLEELILVTLMVNVCLYFIYTDTLKAWASIFPWAVKSST
jgi:hypothetical protein